MIALLAQSELTPVNLTTAGAVVMIVSVVFVLALNAFCMYRILRSPGPHDDKDVGGTG
ncbi:MAG: hypothetical protein JXO22_14745 [Phycisphaerae bacterium]|nr:hypothetical protein [Phycisphaerae bacterium]